MVELKGYFSEEVLDEMLFDGTIGRMEYIFHHSEAMKNEFLDYCKQNSLPVDDESAEKFFDHRLKKEEQAHTPGLD